MQGRCKTLPLCESSRDDIIHSVRAFLGKARPYDVLIVSYETFRIHAKLFENAAPIDLLLCDEAHRLKNDETKTNKALDSLTCRRRVLLSGTPMQNHLDEARTPSRHAPPHLRLPGTMHTRGIVCAVLRDGQLLQPGGARLARVVPQAL